MKGQLIKRGKQLIDLRDIASELSDMEEVFDPEEINRFIFDFGYYSALLYRNMKPDEDDLERLTELKQILKEAHDSIDNPID